MRAGLCARRRGPGLDTVAGTQDVWYSAASALPYVCPSATAVSGAVWCSAASALPYVCPSGPAVSGAVWRSAASALPYVCPSGAGMLCS